MPGSDTRPAMQRLFEAQTRPASAGVSAAEIQQLLAMAEAEEASLARAPMQNAVADITNPNLDRAVQRSQQAQAAGSVRSEPALPPISSGDAAAANPNLAPAVQGPAGLVVPPSPGGSSPPLRTDAVSTPDAQRIEQFDEPQAATTLQGGVDMQRGVFVAQADGAQAELPLGLTPGQAWSRIVAMNQINPGRQLEMYEAYNAAQESLRGQGVAAPPSGPLTRQSLTFEQQLQGQVSPENARRLEAAQAAERQAQTGVDQAALAQVQGTADAFGQRGEVLGRQASEQQAQEEAFATDLRNRMGQFESAIQDVRNRRIDPNRYFGPGAGGRIGAALAVALGELGAGLTGRPNAALNIINSAIERDIQAQQSDSDNARSAANMQGMAIQQMRSIIGDERGAQAAVRAAHYQAFLNQIDQQLTTASGTHLGALQTLRAAVLERLQAEGAVAADRARLTGRVQSQTVTQTRGGAGTAGVIQQRQGAIQAQDAASSLQAAERRHIGNMEPEAQATMFRQEYDAATERLRSGDEAGAIQGYQQILDRLPEGNPHRDVVQAAMDAVSTEVLRGIRVPNSEIRRPTASARMATRAAQERLRRNPNDRAARDTVASARREARARGRRAERAVRLRLPEFDADEYRQFLGEAQRNARGGSDSGPIPPQNPLAGTAYDEALGGRQRFLFMWSQGETARNNLFSELQAAHFLNRVYPMIARANEEFGAEATATEGMVAMARQAAAEYQDLIVRNRSGAALTEHELEMYGSQMPAPNEITLQNVLNLFPDIIQRWEGVRHVHGERLRSTLGLWGLRTDNMAGRSEGARGRARVQQAREAATGRIPEEQSTSRQTFTPPVTLADPSSVGSGF